MPTASACVSIAANWDGVRLKRERNSSSSADCCDVLDLHEEKKKSQSVLISCGAPLLVNASHLLADPTGMLQEKPRRLVGLIQLAFYIVA